MTRPTIAPPKFQRGDVVTTGSTRWIIQTIDDATVTLTASNSPTGIVWTTNLKTLERSAKETS